jgi:hypothetical protein
MLPLAGAGVSPASEGLNKRIKISIYIYYNIIDNIFLDYLCRQNVLRKI